MPNKKHKASFKRKGRVRGESITVPVFALIFLSLALGSRLAHGRGSYSDNPTIDIAPTASTPTYIEAHYPERSNEPVSPSSDATPSENTTYENTESSSVPVETETAPTDIDPTQEPTVFVPIPTAAPSMYSHSINTIASNLQNFRSMVIDNAGVAYYIDGNTICNTKDSKTLDLNSSFDESLKNPYLAYDPYHNIVYLLVGGSLTVFDITDFDAPKLIMNSQTCSTLRGRLEYCSHVPPQIAILENGALLVPIERDGTYMLDPQTQTASPTIKMYDIGSIGVSETRKLVGNYVMILNDYSTSATIIALNSNESSEVTLEIEAPRNNASSVFSCNDLIYFYDNSYGVCTIAADGTANVLIRQSDVDVKDSQGLDTTNIWSLTVNQVGDVAFYDNTLKCIRLIKHL